MAGVGEELALAREGELEPGEHRVERVAEPGDLVAGGRDGKPLAGRLGRDAGRTGAHRLDGTERARRHAVAGQRGEQEGRRSPEEQEGDELAEGATALLDRGADDDQPAALSPDRGGEEADLLVEASGMVAVEGQAPGGRCST